MASRAITLDADSTTIRLMEVREGRVIRWASLSLELTTDEEESLEEAPYRHNLGTEVKRLMASSGIEGKDIIASVSGLYSVTRILAMSELPRGLSTPQAIVEAAEKVMPISAEQLYLSWKTVTVEEGNQQTFIIGVPRDVIDAKMRALKAAGINPRILDLKAMALAKAVNREQALVLNIEPSDFDIVMVVRGLPVVMRTVAWQQDNLTLEDRAEHLVLTLELTVGYYNSNHPYTPLDPATPFFVTGEMSRDLALVEELQARVRYPVEPLTPPLECPAHMPVSQYAVNIGLALKGMAPSENLEQGGYLLPDINLLPDVYKPWKPSTRQIYFFCAIVAAMVLLFPLYQVTSDNMNKTANLQAKYKILNNELQRRQLEIKKREPLQQAIAEYRTIVDRGSSFTGDLEVINSEAEKLGVQVASITHEGKNIIANCQANSYITFREYITALEKSGRFSTPIPPPEGYPYITGGKVKLEPKASE